MTIKKTEQTPGIGDVLEDGPDDLAFPQGSRVSKRDPKAVELSPSRRRAAARTKTFTSDVNPELYAVWNDIREDNEQSVVRALELSLISFLDQHGISFEV